MKTLSIELQDETIRLAADKARQARMTLSEWIASRITGRRGPHRLVERDAQGYPLGWFDRTGGSLADVEDFAEPPDFPENPVRPLDL